MVLGGMTISCITSLLSPTCARLSPYALMAIRVLNGFGQVHDLKLCIDTYLYLSAYQSAYCKYLCHAALHLRAWQAFPSISIIMSVTFCC